MDDLIESTTAWIDDKLEQHHRSEIIKVYLRAYVQSLFDTSRITLEQLMTFRAQINGEKHA